MINTSADISKEAKIGKNTKIWHQAQIRENSAVGDNCILGKNVYIDSNVKVGNNVKIQNNASIYHGAAIEDGVCIGPNVCLTNDKNPRAINSDYSLKKDSDWEEGKTLVKKGASIGAGSVVTKDIPDYCLAYGNPAEIKGYVCKCGFKATDFEEKAELITFKCSKCNIEIKTKIVK